MKKRVLSLVLILCMLVGLLPTPVLATEDSVHVHDESCGYVEAVAEQPCGHVHDESCGFVEAVPEVPCDMDCVDEDGDGEIDHKEGCSYAPAVEGQPCTHVHDEACGYAEAVEGHACTHVHDESCGWAPAVEGHPCGHVCTVESGCLDPDPEPEPAPEPEPDPAGPGTDESPETETVEPSEALYEAGDSAASALPGEWDSYDWQAWAGEKAGWTSLGMEDPVLPVSKDESPEIEIVEPSEALYEAGYSVVLTLPGEWDSYDWQVWSGEEDGWTSLGAEDPILPVLKEMFESFAFRCVVEKDGVKTASAPRAYHEEALTAPLGTGVDPLYFGEDRYSEVWDKSNYLAIAPSMSLVPKYVFDIYGIDNDGFYQTTFANKGYRIVSEVDGVETTWLRAGVIPFTESKPGQIGGSLTAWFTYEFVYDGRYAKIVYHVKNNGSTTKNFKVGSNADMLLGKSSRPTIQGRPGGGGLVINSKSGGNYTFDLIAPTCDKLWYGFFACAPDNTFTGMDIGSASPYSGDGGIAWSWAGTVKPGETWERYVLLGVGELPDPPKAPSMVGRVDLVAGVPKLLSGTAAPGNTVYVAVDGKEYSAVADSSGKFSVPVTLPADCPDDTVEVKYWAVSPGGGVSEVKKENMTARRNPALQLFPTSTTVMEDDSLNETWYNSFIKSSEGTVSHTTLDVSTPGNRTVTYTARTSGFPDATANLTVTVLPKPAALSQAAAAQSGKNFNLTAKMTYTGGLTYTETGFVYGSFQNPTLDFKDGYVKTAKLVNAKNGTLSAAATGLLDGVTYYARAYAKTNDGTVVYGPQSASFGLDVPRYGTFHVKNNGNNTFTIYRDGGSGGTQKVYYRTVNGSAVGDLKGNGDNSCNFQHADGVLTFTEGQASKEVTVKEFGANIRYGYAGASEATKYSNADRTYQMEINRVEGGAVIGTRFATRNMGHDKAYEVRKTLYTSEHQRSVTTNEDNKYVVDRKENSGEKTPFFTNDRGYNAKNNYVNFNVQRTIDVGETNENDYLKATATGYFYKLKIDMTEKSWAGGFEHIWISNHAPNSMEYGEKHGDTISLDEPNFGPAFYTARWEIKGHGEGDETASFPGASGATWPKESTRPGKVSDGWVLFTTEDEANVWFTATGNEDNIWWVNTYTDWVKIRDAREPQLLDVAYMAQSANTTTYLPGDPITISLIFDEIVDKEYSKNAGFSKDSFVTVEGWGEFEYAGGLDTNVLYFTGTTPDNPPSNEGNLQVTLNCANQIRDMCEPKGIASSLTGSSTAPVGTTNQPTVSVGNITNTNGTLTATISATNADRLEYVWTQTSATPTSGWKVLTTKTGGTVTTRQSSGTWYLHARATSAGGMVKTDYKGITIPASGSGSLVLPTLTLTANNTNWAKTRSITVTKTPSDATVKVKTPGGSTATVVGASYTAAANGTYTFTLTSGGETVSQTVSVSKLDLTAPTVTIDALDSSNYVEPVTLTVRASDSESGIQSVSGTWKEKGGSSQTASFMNKGNGVYTTTSPNQTGTWTLSVTATDKVGWTKTAASKAYTLNLNVPSVTVTRGTANANGSVNYTYKVTSNGQTIQTIQLPDGTVTTDTSGSFILTEPGTYYVVVTDTAGHLVKSKPMTVTNSGSNPVDGEPPEIRLRESTTDWVKPSTGVTVTVSVYDNNEPTGAAWSPEDGSRSGTNITLTTDAAAGVGSKAKTGSFKVTENGTYTVTAQDARGNTAETEIEITNIDPAAPVIGDPSGNPASWTAGDAAIEFNVTDDQSGVKTVTAKKGSASVAVTNNSGSCSFTATENGDYVITATDNVGNTSTTTVTVEKIDKSTPTITVTGGTTGADSLELTVTAANSGGSGIEASTVSKDGGTAETITGETYTVNAAGEYVFTATTGAGLTKSQTVNVYNVAFAETGDNTVDGQIVASGGKVTQPAVSKAGYTLSGWKNGTADWDFASSAVTAGTTLTAQWALNPPTVTVTADPTDGTAAYTGGPVVTLTAEPSHTVAGVTYSYQWYKDGAAISGAAGKTLSLTDVADSGSYTVKAAAFDGTLTSAEGESEATTVTVTKAKPVLSDLSATSITYGDALSASTVSGTAKDPETGATLDGAWAWADGEDSKRPTVAGDSDKTAYSVTFTPDDTVHYDTSTAAVTLTVNKAALTPSVDTVADKVYNGKTDAAGAIKLDGAVLGDTPAAEGTFTFDSADVLGEKTVTVTGIVLTGGWGGNYELVTQTLSNVSTAARITPRPVTLNWSGDQGLVYSGQPVNVTAAAGELAEDDVCAVTVEGGREINAGTYTATATALDNPNYKLPDVVTKEYVIAPKPIVLHWHNMIQIYTGGDLTPKVVAKEEDAGSAPAATLVGVEDGDDEPGSVAISVTQDGKPAEAKNAGSYTVTGQIDGGGNYTVKGSAALTIQKAPVSFTITNNSMKEGEARHGAAVTPSPANAPFTVIYKNQKGEAVDPATEDLEAGTYTIWVTLQDDNYRHAGSTDGKAAQLGIFTVYAQTPPPKYTVKFGAEDPKDETDAGGNPIGVLTGGTKALDAAEAGTSRTLPACGYTCSGYAFTGWKLGDKVYPAGAAYTQEAREVTFTAQWVKAVHTVEGVVDQDGRPVSDVQVTLMLGSHLVAQRHTDAQGKFRFENIAPGLYNLVASKDGVTMTVEAAIVDRDEARNITLPAYKTNSVLVVVPGTPDIVVAHLEENFTDDDKALAEKNENTVVEYKFTVEEVSKDEKNEERQEIQKAAGSATPALYLDITLEKTVAEGDTVTTNAMPESNVLLKSVIPLPGELQGKYGYSVVRCHGEGEAAKAEALTTSENAGGERFEVSADKTTLTIWAKKFSTYAVAYTDPPSGGGSSGGSPSGGGSSGGNPSGGNSSSGGSSGGGFSGGSETAPGMPIIQQPEHGKIEIAPSRPGKGDKVEITVTPDDGYEVDKVIVTDGDGKSVEVARNPDGTYTYTQPKGKVTISARLKKSDNTSYTVCPRDSTCPIWPYTDASTTAWYHDGVHYCIENGLMTGYGNNKFGPNNTLTRGMLAQTIYNKEGRPAMAASELFDDVAGGAWYAEAVAWGARNGVLEGYGNGRFGPDDPITREQLATMLWRYAGSPESVGTLARFTDGGKTSSWAAAALRWAVEQGIVTGKGSGILDPASTATRAEAATMLQRFCTIGRSKGTAAK